MDLANEFLKLKKEKRALEIRLRHMELDRIRQTHSVRKSESRKKRTATQPIDPD